MTSSNLPPEELTARAGDIYGLTPYDLTAPARILVPGFRCYGAPHDEQLLILGSEDDAPRIIRHDYGACKRGCCEAATTLVLSVPCPNMPHCQSCECGDGHEHRLSDEEIQHLKELLP